MEVYHLVQSYRILYHYYIVCACTKNYDTSKNSCGFLVSAPTEKLSDITLGCFSWLEECEGGNKEIALVVFEVVLSVFYVSLK